MHLNYFSGQSNQSNIPAAHDDLARRTQARFNVTAPAANNRMPATQVAQIQQKEQASRSSDYSYSVHWQVSVWYIQVFSIFN